jgi:hypothetical protein
VRPLFKYNLLLLPWLALSREKKRLSAIVIKIPGSTNTSAIIKNTCILAYVKTAG